ncbi:Protein translocase subunit SecA [Bacillus velezensis]|nr:Protein translocase subunit SecA [Bacillus velezensis]
MLGILNKMFDPTKRALNKYEKIANDIDAVKGDYENLSDDALKQKTAEFKERLEKGETTDDLLVEAFAVVREASRRVTGMFPFKVQLMGALPFMRGISQK